MSDQPNNQGIEGNRRDGDRQENRSKQDNRDSRAPAAKESPTQRFSGISAWWKANRPQNQLKGGGPFNFNAPGQPDHWLENVIEFVGRGFMMFWLTLYPLVLIYAAAVAFSPRQQTAMWIGLSWNDLFALIVTVVVNGAHYQIKKRKQGSATGRSIELIAVLVLKTTLILCGLIYSVYQNPWSSNPAPFAMPPLNAMLLNPVFLGLAALIILDTWKPNFLREKIMYDDENQPKSEAKK